MRIINKANNNVLAQEAVVANTLFKRMAGLLGKKELGKTEALILDPCNSIHTFFMRFAIDVLFVDKENKVVKTLSSIQPFRLTPIYFKSKLAIELPSGTIIATSTKEGHTLSITN